MKITDYIGETTAYDKKLMLERKEPLSWLKSVKANAVDLKRLVLRGVKRSWDSQTSTFKRTNYSFETLRAEYFAKTNIEFVENDFEPFGLVAGGGLLTNAGALLADKSPIYQSRVFCTRWNGLDKSNGTMMEREAIERTLLCLGRKSS